jgi:GTP cyclohydrolase I
MGVDTQRIEHLVRDLLAAIGEDPDRPGLRATPVRVARSLAFLTAGYREDADRILGQALFPQKVDSMILVKDIDLFSLCEHHLLPFYGRCHVAYFPREDKVPGASKIVRIVEMYARRLQMQERLTEQIAYTLQSALEATGVAVLIEARHLCMMMRGIEKQNSMLVTSCLLGSFRESAQTRQEFLALVSKAKPL